MSWYKALSNSNLIYHRLCTDYEAIVKLSDGFNGADLRNVCTEAGKYKIYTLWFETQMRDSLY